VDHIEVRAKDENQRPVIRDALTGESRVSTIFCRRRPVYLTARYFEKTLPLCAKTLEGKTFCDARKTSRRAWFTSIEVERYVGGGLNQHIETARVKLTDPDITVNLGN
jgi:thiamine biosynthesis protein ThiI